MMLRVHHTKLTVSPLGGKNKLQKHMYNIMPTAHIYIYMNIYIYIYTCLCMNRTYLKQCCSTAHSVMMEMLSTYPVQHGSN